MTSLVAPTTYRCGKCDATDKKLWRDPQAENFGLTCYHCSGETRTVDATGAFPTLPGLESEKYVIKGEKIPAYPIFGIPVEAYWNPRHWRTKKEVEWWTNLPSK